MNSPAIWKTDEGFLSSILSVGPLVSEEYGRAIPSYRAGQNGVRRYLSPRELSASTHVRFGAVVPKYLSLTVSEQQRVETLARGLP